jgi:hypothetical protein
VIFLENSNERNLSPAKRRIHEKKEGTRIEKKKRWNLNWKLCVLRREKKRKRGWNLQAVGRDYIDRKKGDHIFL